VRGIIEVVWLERLERHLGAPLPAHFDLVLGTGVSAIVGFALALGLPPAEIRRLWARSERTAFAQALRRAAGGTFTEAYARAGLEAMLRQVFGTRTLGELAVRTVGLSFDPETQQLLSVASDRADPALPVWAAVDAATQHPLYVDPFVSTGPGRPFRPRADAAFVVASFGTGRIDGGLATEVFGERSVILRELLACQIGPLPPDALFPASSFYRFQTSVPARACPIDRIESIDELEAIALSHLADGLDDRLAELAARLRGEPAG
jgi:hypothetical protein